MIQDPPKRVYNPVTRGTLQVVEGMEKLPTVSTGARRISAINSSTPHPPEKKLTWLHEVEWVDGISYRKIWWF